MAYIVRTPFHVGPLYPGTGLRLTETHRPCFVDACLRRFYYLRKDHLPDRLWASVTKSDFRTRTTMMKDRLPEQAGHLQVKWLCSRIHLW